MRSRIVIAIALLLTGLVTAVAEASWSADGTGNTYSKAKTMPAGHQPTISLSGDDDVVVSWTAASGGPPVSGYEVNRYDTSDQLQSIGGNCSGTVTGTTCTENSVPSGRWKYSVTPLLGTNWRGDESPRSSAVTIGPFLGLDDSSVATLPDPITGEIMNFADGENVTFRLDNAVSGQVLSGSTSPDPVPPSGTADVSVTIPPGTSNGPHTIYAVGDLGTTASAPITVSVGESLTMSAWHLIDNADGNSSLADKSDALSFTNDFLTKRTGNFSASFAANRYVDLDYYPLLPSDLSVSSAAFNFRFAANGATDQACVYFEVREASTGNVIGTHGNAGSPVKCVTGTTFDQATVSLPEVTSTAIANDLRIRVFAKVTGNHPLKVDTATITGTHSDGPFTLYESRYVDAADTTPATTLWPFANSDDGAFYTVAANWAAAFGSRYLSLTFPSEVPNGATVDSVTLEHSYRSSAAGVNACNYIEIYSGVNLIGTHGDPGNPVSCNSLNSSWQTDAIPLPEVTTPAQVNGLTGKIYMKSAGLKKTQHDRASLDVSYTP